MLLQIVPDAGDIRRDLLTVRQADTRDFTQSRIRLLGGNRLDLGADSAPLGIAGDLERTQRQVGMPRLGTRLDDAERRRLDLFLLLFAALTDQLADRWHFRPLDAHKDGLTVGGPEPPDYSKADLPRQREAVRRRTLSEGRARRGEDYVNKYSEKGPSVRRERYACG